MGYSGSYDVRLHPYSNTMKSLLKIYIAVTMAFQ